MGVGLADGLTMRGAMPMTSSGRKRTQLILAKVGSLEQLEKEARPPPHGRWRRKGLHPR